MPYYKDNVWPYSDELYHHGIKGQKWGIRRWQNKDGSWTAAGREKYGAGGTIRNGVKSVGKAIGAGGRAIGRGIKSVGSGISKRYKERHPNRMNDDELRQYISRLDMEKRAKDLKRATQKQSRVKRVVADILEGGAKTLASAAFNKLANKITNPKEKEETTNWKEILAHPERYSDKKVKLAKERMQNLSAMEASAAKIKEGEDRRRSEIEAEREKTHKYAEAFRDARGYKRSSTVLSDDYKTPGTMGKHPRGIRTEYVSGKAVGLKRAKSTSSDADKFSGTASYYGYKTSGPTSWRKGSASYPKWKRRRPIGS